MENKIKELKELATAHEASLEFDACPDESEIDFLNKHIFSTEPPNLKETLNKYQGWSPSDLEAVIIMKIKQL